MGKGRVRNGKTVGYDLATEVQVREEKKGKEMNGGFCSKRQFQRSFDMTQSTMAAATINRRLAIESETRSPGGWRHS